MKKVGFSVKSLQEGKPHEYIIRFVFGGLCTAIAGMIARHYGPAVAGLFLAFPAIFPASVTMIDKHEKRKKAENGLNGRKRGRLAASIDASGAALGTIALGIFALIVWRALPSHGALITVGTGTIAWAAVSYLLWSIRR